ncbi:hypothetical protein, partial [Francisella sp. SYW-9]|uniref:hypothetical protein n=1 Tax=Francisella sp. SYW-9 TaxID=2610888 RepID=UPI001CD17B2A
MNELLTKTLINPQTGSDLELACITLSKITQKNIVISENNFIHSAFINSHSDCWIGYEEAVAETAIKEYGAIKIYRISKDKYKNLSNNKTYSGNYSFYKAFLASHHRYRDLYYINDNILESFNKKVCSYWKENSKTILRLWVRGKQEGLSFESSLLSPYRDINYLLEQYMNWNSKRSTQQKLTFSKWLETKFKDTAEFNFSPNLSTEKSISPFLAIFLASLTFSSETMLPHMNILSPINTTGKFNNYSKMDSPNFQEASSNSDSMSKMESTMWDSIPSVQNIKEMAYETGKKLYDNLPSINFPPGAEANPIQEKRAINRAQEVAIGDLRSIQGIKNFKYYRSTFLFMLTYLSGTHITSDLLTKLLRHPDEGDLYWKNNPPTKKEIILFRLTTSLVTPLTDISECKSRVPDNLVDTDKYKLFINLRNLFGIYFSMHDKRLISDYTFIRAFKKVLLDENIVKEFRRYCSFSLSEIETNKRRGKMIYSVYKRLGDNYANFYNMTADDFKYLVSSWSFKNRHHYDTFFLAESGINAATNEFIKLKSIMAFTTPLATTGTPLATTGTPLATTGTPLATPSTPLATTGT